MGVRGNPEQVQYEAFLEVVLSRLIVEHRELQLLGVIKAEVEGPLTRVSLIIERLDGLRNRVLFQVPTQGSLCQVQLPCSMLSREITKPDAGITIVGPQLQPRNER